MTTDPYTQGLIVGALIGAVTVTVVLVALLTIEKIVYNRKARRAAELERQVMEPDGDLVEEVDVDE